MRARKSSPWLCHASPRNHSRIAQRSPGAIATGLRTRSRALDGKIDKQGHVLAHCPQEISHIPLGVFVGLAYRPVQPRRDVLRELQSGFRIQVASQQNEAARVDNLIVVLDPEVDAVGNGRHSAAALHEHPHLIAAPRQQVRQVDRRSAPFHVECKRILPWPNAARGDQERSLFENYA